MIKVADIYVSNDGCGPYTISACGGVDASYFKVIGKELYFDEDKFNNAPITTTTTQTTTIDPNLVYLIFTTEPSNDYQYGVRCTFDFSVVVEALTIPTRQLITNPQLSYQWQENINGFWIDISGATSDSLFYNKSNTYVRVKVTYQNQTIISREVRGYCVIA